MHPLKDAFFVLVCAVCVGGAGVVGGRGGGEGVGEGAGGEFGIGGADAVDGEDEVPGFVGGKRGEGDGVVERCAGASAGDEDEFGDEGRPGGAGKPGGAFGSGRVGHAVHAWALGGRWLGNMPCGSAGNSAGQAFSPGADGAGDGYRQIQGGVAPPFPGPGAAGYDGAGSVGHIRIGKISSQDGEGHGKAVGDALNAYAAGATC